MSPEPLLRIRGLHVHRGRGGADDAQHVLRGVDLEVHEREIVGLIGETGSGKTTLARTIVGLAEARAGELSFDGEDLRRLRGRRRRAFRRRGALQLVFQDPLQSLDPAMRVVDLVVEGLDVRGGLSSAERRAAAERALARLALDRSLLDRVPADLSGGQRQRVAIARALVMEPRLVVLDEPVSALDATTRAAALAMLRSLRETLGVALLVISHDLTSLVGFVDRIVVMHEGVIVEQGSPERVLGSPRHEYTRLLIASAPLAVRRRLGVEVAEDAVPTPSEVTPA